MMKQKARVGGMTLVEIMIAIGILGILLLMVYMTLHRTTDLYSVTSRRSWIVHQGRVALDEIAEEVRQSNRLNLIPVQTTPGEGVESLTAATQISFIKITKPDAVTNKVKYNTYYTTYMWQASDATTDMADPVNAYLASCSAYQSPSSPGKYIIPSATAVDADNNKNTTEGRLVRVDPNLGEDGLQHCPVKIMCSYLKNTPLGFQVRETYRTVNGVKQFQLRITMVLVFTDERNRVQEETLETTVFLRNSQ